MRSLQRPILRLECLEDRVVPTVSLLSVNSSGTDAGDQRSQIVADANDPTQDSSREVSADGRYVLFQSFADDLIPGVTSLGVLYVRDRVANTTTAVSILPNGTVTDAGDMSISANGKVVIFTAGDGRLYARDLQAQTTAQVSGTGGAGPGGYGASISDDGRFVAFNYLSNDLAPSDTNGKNDIFIRDRTSGTTTLVSHTPGGTVGNDESIEGVISGDGNTVVFRSLATNLTATPDTNAAFDLFAYNVASGSVSLVSTNLAGTATGDKGVTLSYRLDGTGTKVVFVSSSTNLTADTNVVDAQLFSRDLTSGTTRLLSIRPDGKPLTGTIQQPAISNDGRFATFATNFSLSPDPSPNSTQIYLVELATGQLTLASRTPDGTGASGVTGFSVLSGDGRYVVFESDAANLVPELTLGGSGNMRTLFVYDREANKTLALSTNAAGTQTLPVVNVRFAVSRDGSSVAFTTNQTGFGPTDTNAVEDVYATNIPLLPPLAPLVSINRGAAQADPTATAPIVFTVTFNMPVSGFDATDINLSGSTTSGTLVAAVTGGGQVYTVSVSGMTGTGDVVVNVPAGAARTANGDLSPAATAIDNQVQFGTTLTVPPIFAVGNNGGEVRIVNQTTGAVITTFHPLDTAGVPFAGLVEVALGDFNGDGVPDVLVSAANPTGAAGLNESKAGKVLAFDGAALATGTVPASFRTFTPFEKTDGPGGVTGAYTNGLNIATGDVNGDGTVDLIAGTRGGNGTTLGGRNEYGRLVVIDGTSPAGTSIVIGGIQKPFGSAYQKGVVVAAGNIDGLGGDEIAITRGGPVVSPNPAVQQLKVKVLHLQGSTLAELHLAADGSTAFAPFGSLSGPAKAISRDGRVAFVDADGDGKAELVVSALDPLTNPANEQVRVGVYAIDPTATTAAATIKSTGPDAGTYLTGAAVTDHATTHVAVTGTQQDIVLLTQSASSGVAYLAPLTGAVQTGGFSLNIVTGGITLDGI